MVRKKVRVDGEGLLGACSVGGGGGLAVMARGWGTLRVASGGTTMAGVAVGTTFRGGVGANGKEKGSWGIGGLTLSCILEVPVGLDSSWVMLLSGSTLDGVSVAKMYYGVGLRRSETISWTPEITMSLEVVMGSLKCLGNQARELEMRYFLV